MKNEITLTFTKVLVAYRGVTGSVQMFVSPFLKEPMDTTVFLAVWGTAGLLLGLYNQQTKPKV